jgi:hypothetical protein
MKTLWTKNEDQILISNYNILTYKQIQNHIPSRSISAIKNRARYLKLVSNSNLGRKWSVNLNYFKKLNPINCYWAGFIAADGNVSNKRLSIGLSIKDLSHLEQFKEDIQFTGKVSKRRESCQIQINNCKKILESLKTHFNIIPRKSLVLEPPNLKNEKLIKAFIKGYIDGDGSIGVCNDKNSIRITIAGTKEMLEWIKFYFDKWYGNTKYKKSQVIKRQNIYIYCINYKKSKKIAKELLDIKTPFLYRKWKHFL